MEYQCSISGKFFEESQGLFWQQLRPQMQEFLESIRSDWSENSFISFPAFSELLKAYILHLSADQAQKYNKLQAHISERYEQDETLKPIEVLRKEEHLTAGQRLSDRIAEFGGSWSFIILFVSFLVVWMIVNVVWLGKKAYDPYPFILLNLILSCVAALQAPVIMMSQNRQEAKDRLRAEYDFRVNVKAETEIRLLHEKLDHVLQYQHHLIGEMMDLQLELAEHLKNKSGRI